MITMAGFILLVGTLLLLTQTAFFREKVKIQVIKLAEEQLSVKLDIEAIEGNFYNHVLVRNIVANDNDSSIASLGALIIYYDLWALRENRIQIDSLILEQPHIKLWQQQDSSWNWSSYVKPNEKNTSKQGQMFNFKVEAGNVKVKDGSLAISSFSKLIPKTISGIDIAVSGNYSKAQSYVRLAAFNLSTNNPSIDLSQLSGVYQKNDQGIQLDSVLLITGSSNIDFEGKYSTKEDFKGKINSGKIDKNDLTIFIPSFKLLCSPDIKASFTALNDSVSAWAELQFNDQLVSAAISFQTLSGLFAKSERVPYSLDLTLSNFNVNDWYEIENHQALVDGTVALAGENLLDFNSDATVLVNFQNLKYNDVLIDRLQLMGVYAEDSLAATVEIDSGFGNIEVAGELNNRDDLPKYKARVLGRAMNLSLLIPELVDTKINARAILDGEGFTGNDFYIEAQLYCDSSSIYGLPVDSMQANFNINKSELNIDTLHLYGAGTSISGGGILHLDSLILESLVQGNLKSLEVIESHIELPVLFDSATTVTTISGSLQTLKISGNATVFNAEAYGANIKTAKANYLVSVEKDSVHVTVHTNANRVQSGSVAIDTLKVDLNYVEGNIDIAANVIADENFDAIVNSHFYLGDTIVIDVPKFEVKTLLSDFYLPDTMRARLYGYEKLEIENLRIKDVNQEDFIFAGNGTISTNDSNSFEVLVNHFDLSQLNRFIGKQDSLKGYLETDIVLGGSSASPLINGLLTITDPQFGAYAISSLESKFEYANQNGAVELTIPDLSDSFSAKLNARFNAYFDSLKFVFNPPEEFHANVLLNSFDITQAITSFLPEDSIKGILNGSIDASGEINKPLFNGNLSLSNGQYINVNLGIQYDAIQTSIAFDGNKIRLDTTLLEQDNGFVSISGEMEFDSTILKGNITSSTLQLDADNFFIAKHRNFEVLIDANTFVKSKNQKPEFGGKIKVLRSDLFLPALMANGKTDVENDIPMLVEVIRASADSVVTSAIDHEKQVKTEKQKPKLYDQLKGSLNVEIPKNTWIRSNDMRVELSGELEIVKTEPYFEIFGNVDLLRGYYILYGRRLNIKESQVFFQGGEEMNPTLNIKTEYTYRGSDKEKRTLELLINGELSEPEITFLLDGSEITETDGISVLVFGATSDEIGYGGTNGLLGSVGSNAAASLISSQLSRTIGSQFNLDMIEVTTTENWQSAAFVVGKYITNDIFVVYQRGFGEVDGDEITPEIISVEYEINEKLFLRLQSGSSKESGVDVILKFEQGDKISKPGDRVNKGNK